MLCILQASTAAFDCAASLFLRSTCCATELTHLTLQASRLMHEGPDIQLFSLAWRAAVAARRSALSKAAEIAACRLSNHCRVSGWVKMYRSPD